MLLLIYRSAVRKETVQRVQESKQKSVQMQKQNRPGLMVINIVTFGIQAIIGIVQMLIMMRSI